MREHGTVNMEQVQKLIGMKNETKNDLCTQSRNPKTINTYKRKILKGERKGEICRKRENIVVLKISEPKIRNKKLEFCSFE